MSFFTPPPLRPKCARPEPPGFKRLQRRGVYIVIFTSMAFVGLVCALIAFCISRFLLWSWLEQSGHPTMWVLILTSIGFIGGVCIGNWSGKFVLIEIVKQQYQPTNV